MPEVYLGLEGGELRLPALKYLGDEKPILSVFSPKQVETAQMSDGTIRYGTFQIKREWPLFWGYLTYTQLVALFELRDLNQTLRFQNNWESDTWYNVIMLNFSHEPLDTAMRSTGFKCSFTVKEI